MLHPILQRRGDLANIHWVYAQATQWNDWSVFILVCWCYAQVIQCEKLGNQLRQNFFYKLDSHKIYMLLCPGKILRMYFSQIRILYLYVI